MKKALSIFLTILILLCISFISFKFLTKKKSVDEVKKPIQPKLETINKISLEQRPYIVLEPKSKTKPQDFGHWITVSIEKAANYQSVEYEVEYQSNNLIQGFMHRLDFSDGDLPISKEGFFGSESKGKYKYDEGIKNGSVLFKFFKNENNYDVLKTYFNWQNMKEQEGVFTSNDAKAVLEIDSGELKPTEYLVVFSTLGLPAEIKREVLSEPYGFYSRRPTKLKSAVLTIKSKKDLTEAKILGWTGEEWSEYKTEIKEDEASAKINQLGTYILVK